MKSVFFEADFFLLIATSVVAPIAIYAYLFTRRSVARTTVLAFASLLIVLSGIDVLLLKALGHMARSSLAPLEDKLFNTEISVTLYLLPALFAGIGVNLISHVLVDHIAHAERRFDRIKTMAEAGVREPPHRAPAKAWARTRESAGLPIN
jgi:hypothetical protein